MSEWQVVKLGQLADVRDGTHDSPKEVIDGKFLVTSKHIKNGKVDLSKAYKISISDFEHVNKRSKVDKWDILFSMIGTIGEMTLIDYEPDFAIKNVGLFKCGNETLGKWIYYFLKSTDAQNEISASLKGSTQEYITLGDLRNLPIQIPTDIEEQKAIASVLSSLDDKIDLLHRQNTTLERMAETLFRQWFVEEAQEDWEEVAITKLFDVRDGTHDSPKQKTIGKPLITSKHINGNRLDFDSAYLISDEDFDKINQRSKVDKNDILISMIGTIGLIYLEQADTVNYAIKNVGLFKTSQNPKWMAYTYFWLRSNLGSQFLDEHISGSTQEYVSLGSFRSILFKKPPIEKLEEFNKIANDYLHKIKNNSAQIQTLEKLRDNLLPKLMSGEVRVDLQGASA